MAALCTDRDYLVQMRAFDLLEKLARDNPGWVAPVKRVFLAAPLDAGWEVRLQVVRALPLFEWSKTALARAIHILSRDARHPKKFVRAWAATGLAHFARLAPEARVALNRVLEELESSGVKSLLARARAIRRAGAALPDEAGSRSARSRT